MGEQRGLGKRGLKLGLVLGFGLKTSHLSRPCPCPQPRALASARSEPKLRSCAHGPLLQFNSYSQSDATLLLRLASSYSTMSAVISSAFALP